MATVAKRHDKKTSTQRQGVVPNIISGLATGLFSIPGGMTYAQLAGVNPVYGLYSGVVAAVPNSDGSKASQSRDFLGEGPGNLSGSLFQSMATGSLLILADCGSVSRKGVTSQRRFGCHWGGKCLPGNVAGIGG